MMRKIRAILRAIKINFTLKKILKQKKSRIILFCFLASLLLLGTLSAWRAIASPATKNYPRINFDELIRQIERREAAFIYIKYVNNGKEVREFESDQVEFLVRLKNNDIFVVQQVAFSKLTFTDFVNQGRKGEVPGVIILNSSTSRGGKIIGWLKEKTIFISDVPASLLISPLSSGDLIKTLSEYNIRYWELDATTITESNFGRKWGTTIWFCIALFFFLMFVPIANSRLRENELKAIREALAIKQKITFQDVAGIDEVRADILEILEFIKSPEKFIKRGAKMPKGFLLIGAPGCGKTLLAKAMAGEAGVPFRAAVGSEFVEIYVGKGAKRVRELFDEVRSLGREKDTAVILFIDEIDALGSRGADMGGGGDSERAQTITQVLVEMDGFEPNDKIFVIAATNRPEILDPAIMRPGRFDRQIIVPLPDLKGRKEILAVHCKNKSLAPDVNLDRVAQLTPLGFSGADLANVTNEAAIRTAMADKDKIEMQDFEKSIEKVIVGSERKSAIMSEEDKLRTAFHEAGHGLLAKLTPGADSPDKISIIPTTKGAGGFTKMAHKEDKYYWTKEEFLARIRVCFGGRIAEEIIFGEDKISTGAKADFQQATQIAEEMIYEFGMASKQLGPRTFGITEGAAHLGRTFRRQNYSEETAREVDLAIKNILIGCYEEAKKTIEKHREQFERLAKALKEREILNGEEIERLLEETKKESIINVSPG